MEQQVSLESGAAMYRRLHGLLGAVTPETVAGSSESALREIGVTRQKTAYLLDLGRSVASGVFDLDALTTMPLTEARELLLGVKGIGPGPPTSTFSRLFASPTSFLSVTGLSRSVPGRSSA